MDIAARIDLAMHYAGIKTQKHLARLSGVSEPTLNRTLKNIGQPNLETLSAIARALNRSLDWIVNGTDSPNTTLPEFINIYVTPEELRLIQQLRESTRLGRSSILIAGDTADKKPNLGDDPQD